MIGKKKHVAAGEAACKLRSGFSVQLFDEGPIHLHLHGVNETCTEMVLFPFFFFAVKRNMNIVFSFYQGYGRNGFPVHVFSGFGRGGGK